MNMTFPVINGEKTILSLFFEKTDEKLL